MALTPAPSSTKSNHHNYGTLVRTPQAKHLLNYTTSRTPNPNATTAKEEHPVEVIGRIRDYPDRKEKPVSILQVNHDSHSVRVRTDVGYRDFSLDGVSLWEEEDVGVFYKKFVESRINSVKLGEKCTVMMYGPTGSGKSYTMFGCANQLGIVYRSLKEILGNEDEEGGHCAASGNFVQVTVLEIYNEEIYDLLPNSGSGGIGFGWPKGGSAS
uniref:Kinesin motor domain-containing protein n=1 Tax=Kalanchoe fedtschenkoi TaxID=63787 RepID=A0A7N0VA16_KALFE